MVSLILARALLAAAATPAPCAPQGAAADVVRRLAAIEDTCLDRTACLEQKRALVAAALQAHPDDVFLHRAGQDLVLQRMQVGDTERAALVAQYQARLRARPGDAGRIDLYARTLPFDRDAEREALWLKAVRADPRWAPAHRELAHLTAFSSTRRDDAAARRHAADYLHLCPEATDILGVLVERAPEMLPGWAARQRAALEGSHDAGDLARYRALWAAEFKAVPPGAQDPLRARVAADVARLRSWDMADRPAWWATLAQGEELSGDGARRTGTLRAQVAHLPCLSASTRVRLWEDEHPYPTGTNPEEWKRRAQALYDASADWVRECPQNLSYWSSRLRAVQGLDTVADAVVTDVADHFLELWERPERGMSMRPSPYFDIAALFLDRGLRLPALPGLIDKGEAEEQSGLAESGKWARTESARRMLAQSRRDTRWRVQSLRARTALQQGRLDDARPLLAELREILAAADAGPAAEAPSREYWRRQLRLAQSSLAEAEGRRLDALVLAASVVRDAPGDARAAATVSRLWGSLGGTDEGRALWDTLSRPGAIKEATGLADWATREKPLPDFELPALAGGTRARHDLAGKAAVIVLWATWCGPCMQELPYVQKLHERIKERGDAVLLTFNVDSNPGLATAAMKEKSYTFPVVLAQEWASKAMDVEAIPTTWLVDAGGTIRLERSGFTPSTGDTWVQDTWDRLRGLSAAH